jgi:drug/metabolite transporter (DMT)-like permease
MHIAAVELGAIPTAGLRVGFAALFLVPILLWRKQWPALRRHYKPILFVGLLNSAIPFALLSWAVLSISTGMTAILNATVPMFGALVAWLWLKDKPNASRLLGLAVGFAGVALLAWDKASFKPGGTGWAVVACLVATLFYGIGASYTKRYLTGVNSLALATGSQLGATLGLLVPTLWLWPAATCPACAPGALWWGWGCCVPALRTSCTFA